MSMGQRAELPLGSDEIGGERVGRGGGKMDGEKLCLVLGGKIRMGREIGCNGSSVSKTEREHEAH